MSHNAPHFFHKLNPETAVWFADLCDEVAAKGPETAVEWRRIFLDLLVESLSAGEADARIVLNISTKTFLEWGMRSHDQYDESRSTTIETGSETTTGIGTGAVDGSPAAGRTPAGTGATAPTAVTPGCSAGAGTVMVGTNGSGSAAGSGRLPGPRVQGPGPETTVTTQGTLFVLRISQMGAALPNRERKQREEYKRLTRERAKYTRLLKAQKDLLDTMELVRNALPDLEDLAQKHRSHDTAASVLRAAGITPEEIGLTDGAVTWLDSELRAM